MNIKVITRRPLNYKVLRYHYDLLSQLLMTHFIQNNLFEKIYIESVEAKSSDLNRCQI